MPRSDRQERYSAGLLVLTVATGAADGVSFVALDRVFTGNMTGNVLFVGFGLVGVEGIAPLNNLAAIGAFLVGAMCAALVLRGTESTGVLHSRSLAMLLTGCGITGALALAWTWIGGPGTWGTVAFTAVLALVLGAQAAAVKPAGIRDLSTVVVTMTMVNLSVDAVSGGTRPVLFRRAGAILAMAAGGALTALLTLQAGAAWALLAVAVLMLAGVLVLWSAARADPRHGELRDAAAP